MAGFFEKLTGGKEQKAKDAAHKAVQDAVEGRLKSKALPSTEEPKTGSSGVSVREYFDHISGLTEADEGLYLGWWLIGQFYDRNRGMGREFVEKAVAAYTQLVKSYHKSQAQRPKRIEGFTDYLNSDEAQLRVGQLLSSVMLEPGKALPFFKTFKDYYPQSPQADLASTLAVVIEKNLGDDPAALLAYLKAEELRVSGKGGEARSALEALVRGSPGHPLASLARLKIGDIQFYDEKNFSGALESYEKVCSGDVNDENVIAYFQVGECLRELKQWEKAVESYGQYLMESGSKFRVDFAKYHMAACHEHLSHWDEACLAYEMVADMPKSYYKEKSRERLEEIRRHQQAGTLHLLEKTLEVREDQK